LLSPFTKGALKTVAERLGRKGVFMKSLYFTAEHEIFRRTVRQFVEKEVTPYAEEWEKNKRIPPAISTSMGE
jgi:hypothetical protein